MIFYFLYSHNTVIQGGRTCLVENNGKIFAGIEERHEDTKIFYRSLFFVFIAINLLGELR